MDPLALKLAPVGPVPESPMMVIESLSNSICAERLPMGYANASCCHF